MTETRTPETAGRLTELVDGIRFAMLTTADGSGGLHARPLTVQRVDDDGTIWFLVDADADWVAAPMPSVNVAFTDSNTWVSATGSGELVTDTAVLEDLGDPESDAWFQEGSTPAALKVSVGEADYWDAPGRVAQLLAVGKAKLTGSQPDIGERGVVKP